MKFLPLFFAVALLPAAALGSIVRKLLMRCMSYIPALALTMLAIAACEAALLSVFRLCNFRALFARFFGKKHKKIPLRS